VHFKDKMYTGVDKIQLAQDKAGFCEHGAEPFVFHIASFLRADTVSFTVSSKLIYS